MNQIDESKKKLSYLKHDLLNVIENLNWLTENDFYLNVEALEFTIDLKKRLEVVEIKGGIEE